MIAVTMDEGVGTTHAPCGGAGFKTKAPSLRTNRARKSRRAATLSSDQTPLSRRQNKARERRYRAVVVFNVSVRSPAHSTNRRGRVKLGAL